MTSSDRAQASGLLRKALSLLDAGDEAPSSAQSGQGGSKRKAATESRAGPTSGADKRE